MKLIKESRTFPAFLQTCSDIELVIMQHEARQVGDKETVTDVLHELASRAKEKYAKMC